LLSHAVAGSMMAGRAAASMNESGRCMEETAVGRF